MTRVRFDQFSKDYLAELLTPLGEVKIDQDIPGEPRKADVVFLYSPIVTEPPETFGILARMTRDDSLFEVFRNAVEPADVISSMAKLCWAHLEQQRDARRKQPLFAPGGQRQLWLIVPYMATSRIAEFGLRTAREWPRGIYFLGPAWRFGVVVADRLPATLETLWLRILGRGATHRRAVKQLLHLPADHPLRKIVVQLLLDWRILLEERLPKTEEERELAMNFISVEELETKATARGEAIGEERGVKKGRREERREMLLGLLTARFGELDAPLEQVLKAMMKLPAPRMTALIIQLSREELSREELIQRFVR